ncbi:MAG: hypothetical protein RL213_326 [Bacteroidota bacterium]
MKESIKNLFSTIGLTENLRKSMHKNKTSRRVTGTFYQSSNQQSVGDDDATYVVFVTNCHVDHEDTL